MVVVGCYDSTSWLVWLHKLVVTPMSDLIFEVVLSLSLDGTGATPRWLDPLDLVHGQGAAGDLHNLSRSYTKGVRGSSKNILLGFIYIDCWRLTCGRFSFFKRCSEASKRFLDHQWIHLEVYYISTDLCLVFLILAFYVMSSYSSNQFVWHINWISY